MMRAGRGQGVGPGLHPQLTKSGDVGEPPSRCVLCPRLSSFLDDHRRAAPDWHNAPVTSFGDPNARLVIVGLAPGLKGANRTGRPFTGDYAGDLLYQTLLETGFATGRYDAVADDALRLVDCMITNAVRCVPPENKPTSDEIRTCRQFLKTRIDAMPNLRVILALGRIAHQSVVATLGARQKDCPFGHGAVHGVGDLTLADSYHCSRYNTNTGVLTADSFRRVFETIKQRLET